MSKNVREVALQLLMRIEKEGSFSHLLLSQTIEKEQLNDQDQKLLTEIVYGTTERKMTLDYYIAPFLTSPKKVADWVYMLLRMSLFQMQFLDKVPRYAIIHEAVEIAKRKGHRGIASFVNGVLRNMDRKGVAELKEIQDPVERLSIETSHPIWLVKRWTDYYGYEITEEMCKVNMSRKPVSIRVNSNRISREKIIEKLISEKMEVTPSPFIKDGIIIQSGNILKTDLVKKGLVTIQDQSSMLASLALQVEPQMMVLDTCSAPGGKTTYLAELMNNKGKVYAHDLHEKKINVINQNAKRLGLTNIDAMAKDARKLSEMYENESFDRIIVDAPCSGLGVIRSKPDIKYNKGKEDIHTLQTVQLDILESVHPLLKVDGKLVYSTCTVEVMENEDVVRMFLQQHDDFIVDVDFLEEMKGKIRAAWISEYGVQLFPQTINSDGFFMTRLIKRVE